MFIDSIRTVLAFTFVLQCTSFTLDLSEPIRSKLQSWHSEDSEYSRINSFSDTHNQPNSSESSTWVGWNWKTPTPPTNFVTGKSLERKSDWTWKEDASDSISNALEEKTLHLQVLEDESHGDRRKHRWPHEDSIYDPYAFQHQNRLGHAQTQLHVHNQLDPYSLHPHNRPYEWQDLRPIAHSPFSHYAPNHHHHTHAHVPSHGSPHSHHVLHGGLEFGSGVSASNPSGQATDARGHGSIVHSHASAHAQGFPIPGGSSAEASRKYGPHYHYHPPGYKRKRYKLEVHPGFIAAPIAGLAAFGVAHAFTSQPLLFELGLVDKKKGFPNPHHHHHHVHPVTVTPPCIAHPDCYQMHSHNNYPHQLHPSYHPQHQSRPHPEMSTLLPHAGPHPPQSINHHHPTHPSLRPIERPPHQEVEQESKPWWSPLAAMIPRLRKEDVERD